MPESAQSDSGMGEKERVYAELERVQHKCARLKREVTALRQATGGQENAILRREVDRYRSALSNIVYRLDTPDLDSGPAVLRQIANRALLLQGLKAADRRRIRREIKKRRAKDSES